MIRRPPRSTQSRSSAASDVYKRQREHWPAGLLQLAAALGQPQTAPVGRSVTSAFETVFLHEAFQQHGTVAIACLPLVGQLTDQPGQQMGSQVGATHPWQK